MGISSDNQVDKKTSLDHLAAFSGSLDECGNLLHGCLVDDGSRIAAGEEAACSVGLILAVVRDDGRTLSIVNLFIKLN